MRKMLYPVLLVCFINSCLGKNTFSKYSSDSEVIQRVLPRLTRLEVPGRIMLHRNPRRGDFAYYKENLTGGNSTKILSSSGYEVISAKEDQVVVRYTNYGLIDLGEEQYRKLRRIDEKVKKAYWGIIDVDTEGRIKDFFRSMQNYCNELYIDFYCTRKGLVNKAILVDKFSKKTYPLQVSGEGEEYSRDKYELTNPVSIGPVTYTIDGVQKKYLIWFVNSHKRRIQVYYSHKVPFLTLKSYSGPFDLILVNSGNKYAHKSAGKTRLKRKKSITTGISAGIIYRAYGTMILVGSSRAAQNLRMGTILYCYIANRRIPMRVTFPMMTVARCKLDRRYQNYARHLRPGIRVYR